MLRMRFVSSELTDGRPFPLRPRRDLQVQKAGKPCRCQRITVSGRTTWSASRHPWPPLREPHPEGTIEAPNPRSHRVAAEQNELLPEREVLEREVGVGPEIETAMGRRVRRSFVATKRQQSNGRADPPSELPTEGIGCWSMGRACIEALLSPVSNGIE